METQKMNNSNQAMSCNLSAFMNSFQPNTLFTINAKHFKGICIYFCISAIHFGLLHVLPPSHF